MTIVSCEAFSDIPRGAWIHAAWMCPEPCVVIDNQDFWFKLQTADFRSISQRYAEMYQPDMGLFSSSKIRVLSPEESIGLERARRAAITAIVEELLPVEGVPEMVSGYAT
jgi:hypothetical protein